MDFCLLSRDIQSRFSIRKGIVQLTVFSRTPTWAVTLPMEAISPDKMIKYAWSVLKRQELIKGKALNLLSSKPNAISFRFWWPSFRSISSEKSCQKARRALSITGIVIAGFSMISVFNYANTISNQSLTGVEIDSQKIWFIFSSTWQSPLRSEESLSKPY